MRKLLAIAVVLVLAGCALRPFYVSDKEFSLLRVETGTSNYDLFRAAGK